MMISETTKKMYRKPSKGNYLQIASHLYLTHVNNMSAEDIFDSDFHQCATRRRNGTLSAARPALNGFRIFVNFYFLKVLYD
jgi:hypothetical protein